MYNAHPKFSPYSKKWGQNKGKIATQNSFCFDYLFLIVIRVLKVFVYKSFGCNILFFHANSSFIFAISMGKTGTKTLIFPYAQHSCKLTLPLQHKASQWYNSIPNILLNLVLLNMSPLAGSEIHTNNLALVHTSVICQIKFLYKIIRMPLFLQKDLAFRVHCICSI